MNSKPGVMFYITMFVIIVATMLLHETCHWLAGEALGYDMVFTLTKAGPIQGGWNSELDYALVSAAGPAFTFLMGLFGAWLAIAKKIRFGYELIFVAFMQRALAMGMSALFIPNDEARISLFLGLPWWVLPAAVVVPLLLLTIWSSRALRFGFVVNFLCYLVVSITFTLMVYLDGQLVGHRGPSILDPFLPEAAQYSR